MSGHTRTGKSKICYEKNCVDTFPNLFICHGSTWVPVFKHIPLITQFLLKLAYTFRIDADCFSVTYFAAMIYHVSFDPGFVIQSSPATSPPLVFNPLIS